MPPRNVKPVVGADIPPQDAIVLKDINGNTYKVSVDTTGKMTIVKESMT